MAVLDWLLMTRLFTARAAWFEVTLLTVTGLLAAAILRYLRLPAGWASEAGARRDGGHS
ncbi:hypothetical protein AB0P32_22575 [Streptomyces sp. NPDC085995]|uniref:hypothetical protein n=1 Tax=Streptomyces sp. NPDC085995 TaxID=3154861 RepID=UPI003431140C